MKAKTTTLVTAATVVGVAALVGGLLIPTGADASTPSSSTGSLTIQLTAPIERTKTVPASVTCTTTAHSYRAIATSRVINGHTARVQLSVAGYHGPGTYPAIASVTISTAGAAAHTIALPRTIKTTLSSTGGSVGLDTTTKNGRHLAGTASWTC